MKIYSSRNTDKFDKFVGKDLWVKIRVRRTGEDYFYRFRSKDADGAYVYNRIPTSWFNNDLKLYQMYVSAVQTMLTRVLIMCVASYNRHILVEPVEAYTTEELFGNILKED